jgi:hypothetical protein
MKIVKQDKYEVGDKVKFIDWTNTLDFLGIPDRPFRAMCGKTATISYVFEGSYQLVEDNDGWHWGHSLIAGKVVEYREVKRQAEVGEWVKITNAWGSGGYYKNGDVLTVKEPRGIGCIVLFGEHECYITSDEYVVLEGYEPPKVTVTAGKPKKETVTLCGVDECGNEVSETIEVPGVSKHKYKISRPNKNAKDKIRFYVGEDVKCGQLLEIKDDGLAYRAVAEPQKRTYTNEQIQEAKDIVSRLTMDMIDNQKIPMFKFDGDKTTCKVMYTGNLHGEFSYEKGTATCSNNDTFNRWIGRMVALCKALGEPLPKWVIGDGK